MEDVYLAYQVIERIRSGEEETSTLAEVEEHLSLAHLTAAEALAHLPGTLSREAGETCLADSRETCLADSRETCLADSRETCLADSRETGLAGSWIGDQPVRADDGGKLAGMIMRLFRLWEISSADKLSLLGLDSAANELLDGYWSY